MTVSMASSLRFTRYTRQFFSSADASSRTTAMTISLTSLMGRCFNMIFRTGYLSITASGFLTFFRPGILFALFGQLHTVFVAKGCRVCTFRNLYVLLFKCDKGPQTPVQHFHIRILVKNLTRFLCILFPFQIEIASFRVRVCKSLQISVGAV